MAVTSSAFDGYTATLRCNKCWVGTDKENMSVYVDSPVHQFGRMVMCHLVADTIEELHAMADKIGVARKWFQHQSRFPHYDICKTKRALAVRYGAKEITSREIVKIVRGRYETA